MIFQAPILALLLVSALAALVSLWGAVFGVQVLRHWDVASGARTQIRLERTTELVSTLFGAVLLAEIAALLLFVYNADRMGRDYPLTRVKYAALLPIAALLVAAGGVELAYFLGLETDVITSCCSKLFTPVNDGLAAEMTGLAPGLALWLLAGAGGIVAATGGLSLATGRGQGWFALAGAVMFVVALAAIVSVISLYVYDHPNHHCPFCLLQREHGYYGYVLYLPLFAGTAFALGAGVTRMFHRVGSLSDGLPALTRRLVVAGLVAFGLFGVAVLWAIASSQLILFG